MEESKPDAGRLTRDTDIAFRREDLETIASAVKPHGLEHRHVDGLDFLDPRDCCANGCARPASEIDFLTASIRVRVGIHLTQVAPIGSVFRNGGLSADADGV